MIRKDGSIRGYNIKDYNLDNIRTGHFVTRMYQLWPEEKNLKAMQLMMKQLKDQPRTKVDRVFWHKAIYSYQVWLDGIFMGLPFRCLTAPITEKGKNAQRSMLNAQQIYDDAVDQLKTTYVTPTTRRATPSGQTRRRDCRCTAGHALRVGTRWHSSRCSMPYLKTTHAAQKSLTCCAKTWPPL